MYRAFAARQGGRSRCSTPRCPTWAASTGGLTALKGEGVSATCTSKRAPPGAAGAGDREPGPHPRPRRRSGASRPRSRRDRRRPAPTSTGRGPPERQHHRLRGADHACPPARSCRAVATRRRTRQALAVLGPPAQGRAGPPGREASATRRDQVGGGVAEKVRTYNFRRTVTDHRIGLTVYSSTRCSPASWPEISDAWSPTAGPAPGNGHLRRGRTDRAHGGRARTARLRPTATCAWGELLRRRARRPPSASTTPPRRPGGCSSGPPACRRAS